MISPADAVSGSAVRASAWAPLRMGVFRAMYLAVLVSNIGTWMQTVGAQWLLVNRADAAILVPLIQVMDTAPDVLLSVVGGVLIAQAGVGAVFALNTATFLVLGLVLAAWRPPAGARPEFPERFISALHAGTQYVRFAPVVRRILLRSALFLTPASVLWALLPLVASEQLGLGPVGY